MIPDMTPWSYPKRKTPNDTNILVKYLAGVSNHRNSKQSDSNIQQRLSDQPMYLGGLPVSRRHDES